MNQRAGRRRHWSVLLAGLAGGLGLVLCWPFGLGWYFQVNGDDGPPAAASTLPGKLTRLLGTEGGVALMVLAVIVSTALLIRAADRLAHGKGSVWSVIALFTLAPAAPVIVFLVLTQPLG